MLLLFATLSCDPDSGYVALELEEALRAFVEVECTVGMACPDWAVYFEYPSVEACVEEELALRWPNVIDGCTSPAALSLCAAEAAPVLALARAGDSRLCFDPQGLFQALPSSCYIPAWGYPCTACEECPR